MKHPTRSHEVHSDADPLLWPHCGHAGLLVPDDKRIGSKLTSKDGSACSCLVSQMQRNGSEVVYVLMGGKSKPELRDIPDHYSKVVFEEAD